MSNDAAKRRLAEAHLAVLDAEEILRRAKDERRRAEGDAHYRGESTYSVIVGDQVVTIRPRASMRDPSEFAITKLIPAEGEVRSA